MYRYRNDRSTHHCIEALKHLPKIGEILEVRGVRYFGRYGTTHEAVIVRGTKGYIRYGCFLWSYKGEGPRGLVQLIMRLGLPQEYAEGIAFETPRLFNRLGNDWRLIWMPTGKWRFEKFPYVAK